MASVGRLRVFPVKGLDGIDVDVTEILDGGTLSLDREWALFDANDDVIQGKRTERVHELDVGFDPEGAVLDVQTPAGKRRSFALDEGTEAAAEWFGAYFAAEATIRRNGSRGFVDRPDRGPSVVSTATVRTVASWFDDVTVEGARRRLRANVEIEGVPPFWEDRFVGSDAPDLVVGDEVRLTDATPCGRCVVPTRDPDTGDPIPEFQRRFVEKRRETFPDWADERAFDHFYAVMIITSVPAGDRETTIRVGDDVAVADG